MKPKTAALLLLLPILALPQAGRCESTNEASDLFGVTVTQTVYKAEQQFELGNAYSTGDGVEADAAKAVECFGKAAELGHAKAQFNLATCHLTGNGVEQSDKTAAQWFRKAADQGIKEAYHPLGVCCYNLEQYAEAYAWALLAESVGDARLKEMFDPMFTAEEIAAGKARFEELKKTLKSSKPE